MRSIVEKIKRLDTSARVRLVFLALILVWCTYLSVGFAYEFSVPDNMKGAFLDVSDIKDVYVDGSDVTFAVVMLGMAGNLMLGVLFLIVFVIYFVIVFFASLIPVLVLRFVGLRKKYTVDEDEAYLSVNKNNPASLKVQQNNGAYIHHENDEEYFTRIKL